MDDRHALLLYSDGIGREEVFYTTDGAQLWQRISDGLSNTNVRGLGLSVDGSILYAGTIGGGVYSLGNPGE